MKKPQKPQFIDPCALIKPGAWFAIGHDSDIKPLAICANGLPIVFIDKHSVDTKPLELVVQALNDWAAAKACNDALHRRLVRAEEALLRIKAECDGRAREMADGALGGQ